MYAWKFVTTTYNVFVDAVDAAPCTHKNYVNNPNKLLEL